MSCTSVRSSMRDVRMHSHATPKAVCSLTSSATRPATTTSTRGPLWAASFRFPPYNDGRHRFHIAFEGVRGSRARAPKTKRDRIDMAFKTTDLFRPVSFRPGDALNQLKRSLRDLGPLAEHGEGFAVQSQRVIELRSDASFITVRLARRHAHSP